MKRELCTVSLIFLKQKNYVGLASIAVEKSLHDFSVEMLKLASLLLEYVLETN